MKQFTFSMLLVALLVVPLFSQESPVEIHGAISQSFIYSKNNHYIYEGSKGGSLDYSEAFINFSRQFGRDLRIGLQISSRNFGQQDDFNPKLDWAYGDYRPFELLGVRFGKVKLPLGIYNESRDVDFAKPQILLDQGIYPESFRLLINSYSGGSIYGNINLNSIGAGDIEYEVFGGTTSLSSQYPSTQYTQTVFNSPTSNQNDIILAGSNIRAIPFDYIKLGHSYLYVQGNTNIESASLNTLDTSIAGLFDFPIQATDEAIEFDAHLNVFSIETQFYDFILAGEFELFSINSNNSEVFVSEIIKGITQNVEDSLVYDALLDKTAHFQGISRDSLDVVITQSLNGGMDLNPLIKQGTIAEMQKRFSTINSVEKIAWYLSLFYQMTDDFGIFTGFGYTNQKGINNATELTQYEQNSRVADQKDYSIGLNFYVTDNFLLKGEYHYIDGIYGVYNPIGDPFIDDGNLWVGRVSYSF